MNFNSGVSYDISESTSAEQGTKILIYLKADCRKFSEEDVVKEILSKHSSFVGFPVTLNSTVLNPVPVFSLNNLLFFVNCRPFE